MGWCRRKVFGGGAAFGAMHLELLGGEHTVFVNKGLTGVRNGKAYLLIPKGLATTPMINAKANQTNAYMV